MQRSLVKEFKASNSSIYQSTVLGTHSFLGSRQPLTPRSDTQQLTSRIAHLPGDQRTDLTSHPQMIIVFQAIEITRLTSQIETLRVKMRERQDVVINAGSYQVQIRELAERCNRVENEKFSYMEELSRTKEMSEVIYNQLTTLKSRYEEVDFSAVEKYKLQKARNEQLALQIEKWKSRYSSLDRAKGENAEASRRSLQLQRESVLHTSTKDLLTKFEGEREQLLGRLRERKEQLDEKQLQLKKLNNCYQQLQIRIQQQEHSIEEYEEKVAMLSQENYRLSQLNRVKTEQIKNLKMANEHDVSMRLSQITCLDETKHKLNNKLRDTEDNNERLRVSLQESERQIIQLKKRASEAERFEFQVSEARRDIQSKLKTMERKDKRIFGLQEELKRYKQTEQQLGAVKRLSKQLVSRIQILQGKINEKVQELNRIRSSYQRVCQEHQNQVYRLNDKMKQYQKVYSSLQNNYKQIMKSEKLMLQKSNQLQLEKRETMLKLKQKDYTISSLQNQLKQIQARYHSIDQQHANAIYQLQQQMQREKQSILARENQTKNRQYQQRMRQFQVHLRDLQYDNQRKDQQNSQLRRLLSGVVSLQDELSFKQTEISTQLRSFQSRLNRIEELLSNLRINLVQRHKAALQNQQRLKITQSKYQQLQQWFFRLAQSMNKSSQYSPSPKKRTSESPTRPFISPQRSKQYQSSYAMGTSIYGFKTNGQNINSVNTSLDSIPAQWLLKFVLLCAQVQSLRKKVGDKQAKVQSMRNSIASKQSSSTFVNMLGSSTTSHSGFYTSRENSLNRKGNVYY